MQTMLLITRHRLCLIPRLWLASIVLVSLLGCQSRRDPPQPLNPRENVGRASPNRTVTPVNQVLTPLGLQLELPGLRPQVLALSPNGRLLAVSGKTSELLII